MPFKFSFPLPGRKPSDDTDNSPILIDTPNGSHDDSPLSDPGSKAERVLGCFEQPPSHRLSSRLPRKALRKKPSYMSVTFSEVENDFTTTKDGFPFPDMPSPRESSRRPSHNLRNQPSSPLLGERFFKGSPDTDSLTNSPSPRPHFYGSSSTLRSYYDPTKSPLSISQQTSASSARDMALRKGHTSVASPLSQDMSNVTSPSNVEVKGRPEHTPVRTPAQLDQSDRFPKARASSIPLISPEEVAKPPSQLSHSSSQQSASSGRPNWWKRKKAKESKLKKATAPPGSRLDQFDLGLDPLKTNIKKSKAGTRHWFDSVGDYNVQDAQGGKHDADEVHRQLWNQRLGNLRPEADNHPAGGPEQRDVDQSPFNQIRILNDRTDTEHTRVLHGSQDSLSQGLPHRPNPSMSRSRSSTNAKADLSNQSFLELSSSSDEEMEDHCTQEQEYRRYRIRDSIDQHAIGEDFLVSSAEKVRSIRPMPIVSTSPRRSKRGSELIPPVPKIPERPQLQQRVSSIKWREIENPKTPTITTRAVDGYTSSSGGASIASQASSFRQAGMDSQPKKSSPTSKLMSVTAEEGELLEAMRQRRASIRKDAFTEGYTEAFHSNRNIQHRPRTSGTDGRVSYSGSDRSITPPPSLPATYASPQSFRFPDVPSSTADKNFDNPISSSSPRRKLPRQAPPIIFPPPKASPTESFSPSDILPSTPRSRLSPLTPSFTTQEDDLHNTFGGIEDMSNGGQTMGGIGQVGNCHSRKRTVSSGVVMLDGMEERARVWESEEESLEGGGERW